MYVCCVAVALLGAPAASTPGSVAILPAAPPLGTASKTYPHLAVEPVGFGYWVSAYDAGVLTPGDALSSASMVGEPLPNPVAATAATGGGGGYRLQPTKPRPVVHAAAAPRPVVHAAAAPRPVSNAATAPVAMAGNQVAAKAISVALALVGTPYVSGGSGPGGFDCSGLTQYAYRAAGVYLPRTAAEQFASEPHVPLADAQPGDLLFFYSGITHVGINLGNGLMVDAPHTGGYVRVESYLVGWGPVMGVARPW